MFGRTSVVSLKVAVMLMILGSGVEAAPTERGKEAEGGLVGPRLNTTCLLLI